MTNKERGSIFFYILIGIALFAALSFAVTQSVRMSAGTDGTTISSSEKATLNISDIGQYMETLKMRVFQLTNSDGIPEGQLDFRNDVYKLADDSNNGGNTNASCTTSSCRIFSPYNPTGVIPVVYLNGVNATAQGNASLPQNGHGQVKQIIISGVGSPEPELVFLIHGVTPELCNSYNAKQGLTSSYSDATTLTSMGEADTTSVPVAFTGSYSTTNEFGEEATEFAGKKSFCAPAFTDAQNNKLAIWQVLKIR